MDNRCLTAGTEFDLSCRIDYSRTGRKQPHGEENMRTKPCLTSADAQKMMAACKAEAEKNKWKVSIAIVDDAEALLHLERMEGAGPTTPEVAHGKARTAALTKQPTRLWEERVKERPAFINYPAGLAMILLYGGWRCQSPILVIFGNA